MKLIESDNAKILRSDSYNYNFNKNNGLFIRWGKTVDENPEYSPFGPEILDCEITTICHGIPRINDIKLPCPFCYKSNTDKGKNMSLELFISLLNKFPKIDDHFVLTQVAFGSDSEATSNPALWDMMDYCRSVGIIPNITVANISDDVADKLTNKCGAVSVSRYGNKTICYNSVQKLTDRGLKQVNLHLLVAEETFELIMETMYDRMHDDRLKKVNALVLLSLKKRGRGLHYHQLSQDKFKEIIDFALNNNIQIGFDSCSCNKFLKSICGHPHYERFEMMAEPCESLLFSFYINVDGKFSPCSFCEDKIEGFDLIDIISSNNFIKDIWNSNPSLKWRSTLLPKRECPIYNI